MYITRIDITEMPPAQPGQPWRGLVALFSGGDCVRLHCSARTADRAARRARFVEDALRQLRRMPEFRRGARHIALAPGLRPRAAPAGA